MNGGRIRLFFGLPAGLFQFLKPCRDLLFQPVQVRHDFAGGGIGHRRIGHLFVLVDGQVVAVVRNLLPGHKETLLGAVAAGFLLQVVEAVDDVGDVVVGHLGALVVQAEAVGLHVVEPHVFRAARAGLGEHQHRRGHPGVGLEHAGGHGDDRPELMVLHQLLPNGLVGLGGAEQHPVRHDAGALSALFQHPQEQGQKQQLGLFGIGDGFQIVADALGVHRTFEGGIGQAHGELVPNLILLGHAILVVDLRAADGVEHQVHGGDAQHGAVGVKAGKHGGHEMLPLLAGHGALIVAPDILRRRHQKTRRTAGRVADGVLRCGLQQLHHHVDDVPGCAELAVLTRGGQLAQHILVQIALHIQPRQVVLIEVVQPGDDFLQHLGRGDEEHGVAHIAGKGGVALAAVLLVLDFHQFAQRGEVRQTAVLHILDGGEDPLGNHVVNRPGVVVLELAPAHGLAHRGLGENLVQLLAGCIFKFLGFQFLFVQRTDKHQIGQLLDDCQGVGDASRPNVRPDFIYFIFDVSGNHLFCLLLGY